MAPTDYITLLLAPAQATQKATGIPASFTLAQGAVESSWNSSEQALQDFNLFGIKADEGWTGDKQNWLTREVVNGRSVLQLCAFRKYPNLTAGLEDHAAFLTGNLRYAEAFNHKNDSCAFAQAIAAAGYATDPNYAKLIISIIEEHKLKQYDNL